MQKPIVLALFGGVAATAIVLACPRPPEGGQVEVAFPGYDLVEQIQLGVRLDNECARVIHNISERETIIDDLFRERISLDDARQQFRWINDHEKACWTSLRSTYQGRSDDECLDLQLRRHVNAYEATPEQEALRARILARLQEFTGN